MREIPTKEEIDLIIKARMRGISFAAAGKKLGLFNTPKFYTLLQRHPDYEKACGKKISVTALSVSHNINKIKDYMNEGWSLGVALAKCGLAHTEKSHFEALKDPDIKKMQDERKEERKRKIYK